ncbi:hypothetical protein GGH94_004222 [Coemansia aciculifera]|uniref:Nudix hydrolase domain-containing protein n=2 Tax=Coemansia TaxID=4863 RepID=A0A9W8GTQ9_9FUNG|nr:hypothetical protein GGI19_003433 [Coemansia pectinata]KAJ2862518.1 hypothetical protein GGH94_004222 [Coemansia aciculifera]KAJ2872257.1 hypothetical protein GGH93_004171 [Coemansia aciculifera]KAJ2883028.1 hypothetical protein H4R27_003045 [Coemansia aciculifera]
MYTSELLALRATQTVADYILSHTGEPKPHHIVTGGAIANSNHGVPSVLLVQRAAHERSYPNEWEIPGGHVDPGESILESLSREIYEETALVVSKVLCEFEGFLYWSTKYEEGESDSKADLALSVCTQQLNFCVLVSDTSAIKLDPNEHQQYAWCTRETLEQYRMTPTMRQVVSNALDSLAHFRDFQMD